MISGNSAHTELPETHLVQGVEPTKRKLSPFWNILPVNVAQKAIYIFVLAAIEVDFL